MYSLAVAGLVMLGAKLCQRFGALRVFRAVVLIFGAAMVLMTFSPTATVMIAAQGLAGAAASGARSLAGGAHRRQLQGAAAGHGAGRARFGARRRRRGGVPDRRHTRHLHRLAPGIRHSDRAGGDRVLAELPSARRRRPDPTCRSTWWAWCWRRSAILLISLGFNNLNRWGLGAGAPRRAVRHPRPVARAGHDRDRHRARPGFPEVDAPAAGGGQDAAARPGRDRFAARSAPRSTRMFTIVALEAALNFTVPLYIQIVQGRSPLDTAIAMMPFNLSVFFAAMLIVRHVRQDARRGRSAGWRSRSARSRWSGSPSSCATTGARCRC